MAHFGSSVSVLTKGGRQGVERLIKYLSGNSAYESLMRGLYSYYTHFIKLFLWEEPENLGMFESACKSKELTMAEIIAENAALEFDESSLRS
jgi:hypothetical protein